jgi:hypothetical protein
LKATIFASGVVDEAELPKPVHKKIDPRTGSADFDLMRGAQSGLIHIESAMVKRWLRAAF